MKEYLVVFITHEYLTDFLIINAYSAEGASNTVQQLPKVLDVISVWSPANDNKPEY